MYQEALEKMAKRAQSLLEICKQHDTAIRIGVNQGSLSDRIISRYGNTPIAIAQSAIEWIDICEHFNFKKLVLSTKSSNIKTMIEATLLLDQLMEKKGVRYPLHIGVTEAANGMEGRVKSTVGISALLMQGLGNTIRVSLTESPENEIFFAKKLLSAYNSFDDNCCLLQDGTLTVISQEQDREKWWATVAIATGKYHALEGINNLKSDNPHFSKDENEILEVVAMQAFGIKILKTEIIACPSCGRTQYNIQDVLAKVKEKFSNYPGLKIGVMGCIVNGPGEMSDADFGVVGSTNHKIAIYQGAKRVSNFLPVNEAFAIMEKMIESNNSNR
jgi:(E)-4-hydroxy-3-methylbut-2-enyl-diphosphate synthase